MHIDREDMLELTRRMTLSRSCFSRIAGAYLDEEGLVDGTFHTHFLKLSEAEREKNLKIAKANVKLKNYRFSRADRKPGSIWQLLMALRECELKNDALLYSLYEYIGERYGAGHPYSVFVFYGNYDVPLKGSDRESQWESEEVYRFLVCAVCPLEGEYEPGMPECGFLFPAFANRSTDVDGINVFSEDGGRGKIAEMFNLAR